jgi:hypothetical protein
MTTLAIKTQTKRATNYKEGILNVNLFLPEFELGIVTTKSWGDYIPRDDPLIVIDIGGEIRYIDLSEFKKMILKMPRTK